MGGSLDAGAASSAARHPDNIRSSPSTYADTLTLILTLALTQTQTLTLTLTPPPHPSPPPPPHTHTLRDKLVSRISRKSINVLKDMFREEMGKEDWQLVVKLKKVFKID
jgi:hypothetical protein